MELGKSRFLTPLCLNHHIFPVLPALGAWVVREQLRSQRREGGLGQDRAHCSSPRTCPQDPRLSSPSEGTQELSDHAQSPPPAILWLGGGQYIHGLFPSRFLCPGTRPGEKNRVLNRILQMARKRCRGLHHSDENTEVLRGDMSYLKACGTNEAYREEVR